MAIAQKFEIFRNRRLKTLAQKKYILRGRTKFGPVIKKLRRNETKRMVAFLDRFLGYYRPAWILRWQKRVFFDFALLEPSGIGRSDVWGWSSIDPNGSNLRSKRGHLTLFLDRFVGENVHFWTEWDSAEIWVLRTNNFPETLSSQLNCKNPVYYRKTIRFLIIDRLTPYFTLPIKIGAQFRNFRFFGPNLWCEGYGSVK